MPSRLCNGAVCTLQARQRNADDVFFTSAVMIPYFSKSPSSLSLKSPCKIVNFPMLDFILLNQQKLLQQELLQATIIFPLQPSQPVQLNIYARRIILEGSVPNVDKELYS
jgi:hypothetical protein